ncbi:SDR family oxidoreductase [Candidatus Enterococcus murrayae]|uniref:SDR family oxidoreductase n=1 Tax=Candidatus Enterococcus murrayae TaxID=2815321 RepID=A0ABS3HG52_9ENTE|nr:SDR family oxidoreductase [Enterococcus sp. MJM16]MBO0452427.1 SDR family oxidoreductase [Enterococcus sp. MJM16]
MKYAVTGATGNLGSRVVKKLTALVEKKDLVAIVHSMSKAKALQEQAIAVRQGDYSDSASMTEALQGIDLLIYIPSKTYDVVQRVQELENTLTAMGHAKVKKIVFVSFFADQEKNPFTMSPYYGYAPRRLAGSDFAYTIVKNALYADPLVPYLPELIERKNIIYPVGAEKLSFISLDDSAEALAQLAIQPELRDRGQTYLLSQKNSYSMPELAAVMSAVTDKTIGYQPVSLTTFAEIYKGDGDGNELASMYHGGALGMLSGVTNDFETITGHAPTDMRTFLQENYSK